jgi:hypothetical protein
MGAGIMPTPIRWAAALALATPAAALAADGRELAYRPAADWVLPAPSPTTGADGGNAPLRVVHADTQIHIGPAGTDIYTDNRVRILTAEGLKIGNLTLEWNPAAGGVTVHAVRIIRQGQAIDVLKTAHFQVIQREGGLEQSMLTGNLTAMLQVPGLQVGDELEMASTIRMHDPTLGEHAFGLYQLPVQGLPGAYRYRMTWPTQVGPTQGALAWRQTRDLPLVLPAALGNEKAVAVELRDPGAVIANDGAPARYNVRRVVEYSDFAGWDEISKAFWPLFDRAAVLAPQSPLQAEVAGIAAASADPAERARAALRLVQDQIRYVYVGLNGGNFRPAGVDETWSRRFGDCKAKTVVLLAVLRALGIEAEPVLVNIAGDDGLDQRLPSPAVFNHVLIRARIGGKAYWLDGTRSGDVWLDMIPAPAFHWALPLRQAGAGLDRVAPRPFERPQSIHVLDLDASAGIDAAARATVQHILRGDQGFIIRTQLSSLGPADADRVMRAYWNQQEGWIVPDSMAWSFDERTRTVVLTMKGTGRPDWEGDAAQGRDLTLWHGGFYPPPLLHRPAEQEQSAPWLTEFPAFECSAVTVHLPRAGAKRRWTLDAEPMNLTIGGVTYWRAAALRDGTVRLVKSRSVEKAEISAAEAQAENAAVPAFNNRMSRVSEEPLTAGQSAGGVFPFADATDWVRDDGACIAHGAK